MVELSRKIAESSTFVNFITAVILAAAVLVGIETYPSLAERYASALHVLDLLILGIFIFEIVVKMIAEAPRPWRYFRDPWNNFDFFIVAAALVPGMGQYAVVLRLLRLLRVLKLVRAIPKLQILVGALLASIPSMFYVSLLLALLFYVYAVAGVFLFGANDPWHFANLQTSMLTLFRAVTLEDWTDLMYIQMYGCAEYPFPEMPGGPVCDASAGNWWLGMGYFVSFVLLGTMIILNLFIGVIMNGMEEAQAEAEAQDEAERHAAKGERPPTLEEEMLALTQEFQRLGAHVAKIERKLRERQG